MQAIAPPPDLARPDDGEQEGLSIHPAGGAKQIAVYDRRRVAGQCRRVGGEVAQTVGMRRLIEDVMFLHLESRLAKALLQLVESVGLRALHSPSFELHVSQRELGNMAGGSRESANKIFQNWHRRGLIDLSKGSIMISNVEAIERLIGGRPLATVRST